MNDPRNTTHGRATVRDRERMPDLLYTPSEAADRLKMHPATLRRLVRLSAGPRQVRLGTQIVRYRESDIARWLEEHSADGAA